MYLRSDHVEYDLADSINVFGSGTLSNKLRKFRQQHKLHGTTRLTRKMGKVITVILETPELHAAAIKILNCNTHKRCNQYQCSHCGVPFKEQKRRTDPSGQVIPFEFPIVETDSSISSIGNFRVDWGNRYHQFEQLHEDKNVFAATINIDLFPFHQKTNYRLFGGRLIYSGRKFRRDMKRIAKKYGFDFPYLGLFEDSIARISDDLNHHVQNKAWRNQIGNAQYAIKLHIHMLVAGITQENFEDILAKEGMGVGNQVRCSVLTDIRIDGHIVKGGSRGWGQYSAKMFMDYNCCEHEPWVMRFTEMYRTVFTKRHRKCSHKCSTNSSGDNSKYNTAQHDIPNPVDEYEELPDAPECYEFTPMYGIGAYTDTSICWNTVPHHDPKSIFTTPLEWLSWFASYVSTLVVKIPILSSIYNSNSPRLNSRKTKRLERENVSFTEQFRFAHTPAYAALSFRKRE